MKNAEEKSKICDIIIESKSVWKNPRTYFLGGILIPRRMEVWYAELPLRDGSSIQGGKRPVLIVSNDICNEVNSIVTVIPMTHQLKGLHLPMHVLIETPDRGESLVLVEQITTIDKKQLYNCIGKIRRQDRRIVEAAIREQLGLKF